MLSKNTQAFLRTLFALGAIKIDTKGGFRLALHDKNPTAPLSPVYINLRTSKNPKPGPLLKEHISTIAAEMYRAVKKARFCFEHVAGIPRAGTPFADAFAAISGELGGTTSQIRLKKESKNSRVLRVDSRYVIRDQRIVPPRVLLVDDVVTEADTKLRAIDALRRGGYEAAGVVVYLDREQGGMKEIAASGVPIVAVVHLGDILNALRDMDLISKSDYAAIKRYLAR